MRADPARNHSSLLSDGPKCISKQASFALNLPPLQILVLAGKSSLSSSWGVQTNSQSCAEAASWLRSFPAFICLVQVSTIYNHSHRDTVIILDVFRFCRDDGESNGVGPGAERWWDSLSRGGGEWLHTCSHRCYVGPPGRILFITCQYSGHGSSTPKDFS